MIVIDASVLVDALLGDDDLGDAAREALAQTADLHAPELIYPETLSACRRAKRLGWADDERIARAVARLAFAPIMRASHVPFIDRVWALRDRCSAYDANYVALAEVLDAPLVTTDRKLANAVADICDVRLVAS